MDIRLKQLSYSSRLTLHSCPRKYQLYKLNLEPQSEDSISENVTFAYGHAVGAGIQSYITDHSEFNAIMAAFQAWTPDLLADNPKQAKSIWTAIAAVQRFIAMCNAGFLSDWNLAYYNGAPATELSFIITFPDGFTYKGFVDAVLVHSVTGAVMVLELKTTSAQYVSAAMYKNSAQAIGYSIVLDALFPDLSSYEVQYLIYKTKAADYEVMPFMKNYLQRALWIRELLLDIDSIKMYHEAGVFPMHGESCNDFFRECDYFNQCTLATQHLITDLTEEQKGEILESNESKFQIKLHLNDLIAAQLRKE